MKARSQRETEGAQIATCVSHVAKIKTVASAGAALFRRGHGADQLGLGDRWLVNLLIRRRLRAGVHRGNVHGSAARLRFDQRVDDAPGLRRTRGAYYSEE